MTQVNAPQHFLRLEYVCTHEERQEASSLNLRQQYGGGSKVRMWFVLLGTLALVLWMAWQMIAQAVPDGFRLYAVIGLVVFVAGWVWIETRRAGQSPPAVATLMELTDSGFRITESRSTIFISWENVAACIESDRLFVFLDAPRRLWYILPKRVLPDNQWIEWVRSVARSSKPAQRAVPDTVALGTDSDVFRLNYRLGYWSMVDLLQASWMGKGILLGWLTLHVYVICQAFLNPDPDAKVPMWEVLVFMELPFIVIGAFLLLLFVAAYSWLQHRRELTPWRVEISQHALRHESAAGDVAVSWDSLNRFKETPWHFILWRRPGGNWLMVPKRALGGAAGVLRCRELLERHLERSTWLTAY